MVPGTRAFGGGGVGVICSRRGLRGALAPFPSRVAGGVIVARSLHVLATTWDLRGWTLSERVLVLLEDGVTAMLDSVTAMLCTPPGFPEACRYPLLCCDVGG